MRYEAWLQQGPLVEMFRAHAQITVFCLFWARSYTGNAGGCQLRNLPTVGTG